MKIATTFAAVVCVAAAAAPALAGGEPKNQPPFTRPIAVRVSAGVIAAPTAGPTSEPKNQPPFTARR
jgi:hypothetical protein